MITKTLTAGAIAAALLLPASANAFTISLPFFRITIPTMISPHYSRPHARVAKRPRPRQVTQRPQQRPPSQERPSQDQTMGSKG